MLRSLGYLLFLQSASFLSGCGEMIGAVIPDSAYVQPASGSKTISSQRGAIAMEAAISAATFTNWTPKTIANESGYLLAEREIRVGGRSERSDSYKLEVHLPPSGKGDVTVKVTPPPRVMGGASTEKMVAEYFTALENALSK
jgi:hypothetical protein